LSDIPLRARRFKGITSFSGVEQVLERALPMVKVSVGSLSLPTRLATHRIVADDVRSPRNLPLRDMSHLDGFAVRSVDLASASESAPIPLKIQGIIGPGEVGGPLKPGAAVRIFTGGYLPEGADAVVPQEEALVEGGVVYVSTRVRALENVVPAGSDVRSGEVVARRGEALSASKVSLLEALGVYEVRVRAEPRVSILSFGDELTDDPLEAEAGKVLNTHAVLVSEMVKAMGCLVVGSRIVPDREGEVSRALDEALKSSDMVITIGGSSVGDIDLVATELQRRSEFFLQGLRLQPGRVGGVAVAGGKPVVMLPGLIHSALNVFNYIAAPILTHISGASLGQFIIEVEASMSESVELTRWIDFRRVVWVSLGRHGAGYAARPNIADASNISSIARSHGFVEVPPNKPRIDEGERVTVRIPLWLLRGVFTGA